VSRNKRSGITARHVASIAKFLAELGNWNDEAADLAPWAIANVLGREIAIEGDPAGGGQNFRAIPSEQSSAPEPAIRIIHAFEGHYEAFIGGMPWPVPPDGDSL